MACLRIGVDARAAAEVPAGRGRFVRELLRALDALGVDHRFELYCREPWAEGRLGERFAWRSIGLADPLWHAAAARSANRSCDVFLSTNSYLTAWMLRVPTAIFVHDMIAFMPAARPQARAARIERATIRPAIRRADSLICNSRSTERDLVARFPRAAGTTTVVPLAADARFAENQADGIEAVARRYGVAPGRFVLATGTLEPRKNLLRLIRAHAALSADVRSEHPLLIVGPRGWEEEEILGAAGAARDTVRLAGFVPDGDLAPLYAACAVFAYPSLYEGFGLPVLEAMAAGAPVVTSRVSSLPEVAEDAARYADPLDESSIRDAIESLLRSPDERAALAARGRARATRFSWDATARQILGALESLPR